MSYRAPSRDMQFVINELADLAAVAALPAYRDQEVNGELVAAVLEEAGRLASEVLEPLNVPGDRHKARWTEAGVQAVPGFREAYEQFVAGGWNGLVCPTEYQGQGLPELLNIATQEMWNAANFSFALCPLLTAGAVEALHHHGSPEQKTRLLEKMVSGEWTGTMNLTESQAGSDLSAVRTRAIPEGDHYRIQGQKIYITWGDHDMTDNIIHLVLARTPDAPEGVKGISLFVVPKFLLNEDGSPGEANDLRCVSIEHKLGIHASPTCVMAYGDNGGAMGYLVGEENRGLAYMFTMMNEARLKVGLQGLAIADRAYQQALDYARQRVQGRPAGAREGERVTIIHHPDVRRMLMTMKSQVEAMRAVCYTTAAAMDMARHHPEDAVRAAHQSRADLLIPVVKAWCTELGVELTSLGIQVQGGMGYVEEAGAAQFLRDARIATIYEGTTGIQGNDLVGRKLAQDGGRAMLALLEEMRAVERQLAQAGEELEPLQRNFGEALEALAGATDWCVTTLSREPDAVLAQAVNYLMLTGYVCGGWQLARAALLAREHLAAGEEPAFHEAKLVTARFYAEQILPRARALATTVRSGGIATLALSEEQF